MNFIIHQYESFQIGEDISDFTDLADFVIGEHQRLQSFEQGEIAEFFYFIFTQIYTIKKVLIINRFTKVVAKFSIATNFLPFNPKNTSQI